MSEHEPLDDRIHLNPPGFCAVPGCTDSAIAHRHVLLGSGEEIQIEVCWKHAEGELDLESLETG